MSVTSRKVCLLFGVTFLAAGILGFVPNPLVSPDGIFAVNTMHNVVHLMTGVVFLMGAASDEDTACTTARAIGLAYVVVTIAGFLTSGHLLLGLVHINEADRWLHAGLAAIIVVSGFGVPRPRLTQDQNRRWPETQT
ncbi:MAG: DUF4383 domain-containing protein [Gammaproteobacteria bacterium]